MPRVKDEMVTDPVAATVPATRRDLLALFVRHAHAGFPVVKVGSRKLVGLVTRQDLLQDPDEAQVALLMDPNPPTTYPEAAIREATRLFVERGLRVLPVVNGLNDLVGLLRPAQLLAALPVPSGHVASHLRRRLAPIHRSTPARVALEVFRATRAAALPLLDDEGRFAGLVTDGDLLAHARIDETTVGTVAGLAADGDAWTWEGLRDARRVRHRATALVLPEGPVSALARGAVVALGPNASLREAVDLLVARGLHHVPVVAEDGRILDVLGEGDLLEALLPSAPAA
jgi:CBS domain-containing protein